MSLRLPLKGSGGGGKGKTQTPTNTPDTLRSQDTVEIALAVSEGSGVRLKEGAKSFYVGDTVLMNADGTLNFQAFTINEYEGRNPEIPLALTLGGTSSNTAVGVTLTANTPVVRTGVVQANSETGIVPVNLLEVRLLISALYRQPKDGSGVFEHDVTFKIEYRGENEPNWHNFFNDERVTIHGKTTSNYVKVFRKPVPYSNQNYQIRVTKLTAESTTENFSTIAFESFHEIDTKPRTYHNTAITHLIGQASDQFTSIPEFWGIYTGIHVRVPTNYDPKTRVYAGTWDGTFKMAWTDNPAWILYDVVMNDRYGMNAYWPINLDKYDTYAAARWCDTIIPGTGKPRYTFNAWITDARSGPELARYIAGSFNGVFCDDLNGSAYLRVDKNDDAVAIFTPEDVTEDGFEYSYTDVSVRYNDITVTFLNEDLGYTEDRRRVTHDPSIAAIGRVELSYVAVGCTNVNEALRRTQHKLLTSVYETELVTFTAIRKGRYLQLYDTILVADPVMGYSITGRIRSAAGTKVTLRDPIFLEAAVSYKINFDTPSGIKTYDIASHTGGDHWELTLTSPVAVDLPEFASFSLQQQGGGFGLPKPYRVINHEEDAENPEKYLITALEINRNKVSDSDNLTDSGELDYSYLRPRGCPPPTNVKAYDASYTATDGTYVPQIGVSWTRAESAFIKHYLVQTKLSNQVEWGNAVQVNPSETMVNITSLRDRFDYRVRVAAVDRDGKQSDWVEAAFDVSIPNDAPPGICTGLTATGGIGSIELKWTNPTDADLASIEVWENTVNNLETATYLTSVAANTFLRGGLRGMTTRWYWVRAVDRSKNKGPFNSPLGTSATTEYVSHQDIADQIIDESKLYPELVKRIDTINPAELLRKLDLVFKKTGVPEMVDRISNSVMQLTQHAWGTYEEFKAEKGHTSSRFADVDVKTKELVEADRSLAEQITTVAAQTDQSVALINDRLTAQTTATEALAEHVEVVAVKLGDDIQAAVTEERQARVTAVTSESNLRTQQIATLGENLTAAITSETKARVDADASVSTRVDGLGARMGDAESAISTEQTARATGDEALGTRIDKLAVKVGENAASIQTEQTARADGDTALTSSITTLNSRVGTTEAAIQSEQTARANGDSALSTRIDTMGVRVGNTEAAIQTEQTTRANADGALSGRIDSLVVRSGELSAAIQTEQTARINGDNAYAGYVSTLQTQMGQVHTSLQELRTVDSQLGAQYVLKTDVNGYVAGFGLYNTGALAEFLVLADRFAVIQPGYGRKVPFIVKDGQVFLDEAFISNASIGTANIKNLSINGTKIEDFATGNMSGLTATVWSSEGPTLGLWTAGKPVAVLATVTGVPPSTSGGENSTFNPGFDARARVMVLGVGAGYNQWRCCDILGTFLPINGQVEASMLAIELRK